MCLIQLDKEPKKVRIGYKVYDKTKQENGLRTSVYDAFHKLGKSYVDKKENHDWDDEGHEYEHGFHFYLKKSDAIKVARISRSLVVKVMTLQIIATGIQPGEQVVDSRKVTSYQDLPAGCAKKITLLEVVKDFTDEKYNSFYDSAWDRSN